VKTALFRYVVEIVPNLHEFTMIAAVPDGAFPQRISDEDSVKNSLPSVPLQRL